MIRQVSIDATPASCSSSSSNNNNHNNSEKLKLKMNPKKKKKRSPVFPQRLYEMLEDAEQEGYSHLICWSPDGMSFKISYDAKNNSNNKAFVEVLKRRFNQTHFKSFLRQLQLYGFERQFKGARKGECKHPLFQRNNKGLLFGKSIEEYQDATTQNAIWANRMCTNQQQQKQQQQLVLVSSTQEVDTNSIPPPPPLHLHITTDAPVITPSCTSTSKCKYRSISPIPTTLTNLVLSDDDDDDDENDDNQDGNPNDYDDDDDDVTAECNGSDNNSLGSNTVFNRTFVGTDADIVPISRKSKVLLMCPLIWNDTCEDYEYDCDCDDTVDMRDENMISVDDHNNNYDVPQSIGSSIYRI